MVKFWVGRWLKITILLIAVAFFAACSGPAPETSKKDIQDKKEVASESKNQEINSSALISFDAESEKPSEKPTKSEPAVKHAGGKVTFTAAKSNKNSIEEQQARQWALELANKNQAIKKIKLCYDKRDNEWWMILYEDSGDHYRLRQFVWNLDYEKPEEFLVLKTISKHKLETHLSAKEPERVCRVIEYARKDNKTTTNSTSTSNEKRNATKSKAIAEADRKPEERRVASNSTNGVQKSIAAGSGQKTSSLSASKKTENSPLQVVHSSIKPDLAKPAPVKPSDQQFESVAFVQATAKEPLREISASKIKNLESKNKSSTEKIESPAKARIISDTGVFAVASIRPAQKEIKTKVQEATTPARSLRSELVKAKQDHHTLPQKTGDHHSPLLDLRPRQFPSDKEQETNIPTYFVFVYGSEMNHQDLLSWLEANDFDTSLILEATPAILEDYDFVWNYYSPSRNGGAVNIEPKKNSKIWGLLIRLEDKALKAFDQKAGHPHYYSRGENRIAVKRADDGKTVFAWVYRAKPNRWGRTDIWPTRSYKQKILEAAMFWHFPEDYISKIKSWPTQ